MLKLKRRAKFWIWPYNGGSNAAQALAGALGGRVIRRRNSNYRRQVRDYIINWGSTQPLDNRGGVVNDYAAVRRATSKMDTFSTLANAGVQVPSWTRDKNVAREWGVQGRILGRDLDNGSQGRGITVYQRGEELKDHKFYVKYIKKEREFRVHVVMGKVIFVQEKLKKKGVEGGDKYIRSHDRGWCFAFHHLNDKPAPQVVLDTGVAAVRGLGLDFGACDIAWSAGAGATVLEVNTAPGIEESSVAAYADAFQALLHE